MQAHLIFIAFASLVSIFARKKSFLNSRVFKNQKCALKLQSVVAEPKVCAQKYLEKLDNELKKKTALLFSHQADSVIQNFEQTYGVQITLTAPFISSSTEGETCFQYFNNTLWEYEPGFYLTLFDNSGDYSISSASVYVQTEPIDISVIESGLVFSPLTEFYGAAFFPLSVHQIPPESKPLFLIPLQLSQLVTI